MEPDAAEIVAASCQSENAIKTPKPFRAQDLFIASGAQRVDLITEIVERGI